MSCIPKIATSCIFGCDLLGGLQCVGFIIVNFLLCLLAIGTTEKIFETKPHLYDVYVDNQNVTVSSPSLKDMLKVSNTDRDKFLKLNNHRFVVFLSLQCVGNG